MVPWNNKHFNSKSECLTLGTLDIWGQVILCCEHCRTVSSIPSLHTLDACSMPFPTVTTKNVSTHCQLSPGGAKLPPIESDSFIARYVDSDIISQILFS